MFKLVIDLNQLQAAFYLQIRQRNRHMAVLKRDVGASGDVTKTTFDGICRIEWLEHIIFVKKVKFHQNQLIFPRGHTR